MVHALDLAALLIAQTGDQYVFGAEALPTDPDPSVFDCSELIQWGGARLGLDPALPDGSWVQWRHCRDLGTLCSIDQAKVTCAALLFTFSSNPALGGRPSAAHVAMSLGDGRTIEARGTRWGVGSWSVNRAWTHAALIPGVDYTPIRITAPPAPRPQEDDMRPMLVRANDGDNAIFITDGVLKTWVRDGNAYEEIRNLGLATAALDGTPLAISRAALSSFALVGPAPAYDPGWTGPRTTA